MSIVDLHDADAHIIMIYTLRRSLEPRKIRACTVCSYSLACYLHAVMYCMPGVGYVVRVCMVHHAWVGCIV